MHVNCGHVQPVYVELQQHVSCLYKRMQIPARASGRAGVVRVITVMHSVHVRHVYSSVYRACAYAAFLLCTAVLASPMGVLT